MLLYSMPSSSQQAVAVARCRRCNAILTRKDAIAQDIVKTEKGLYHRNHLICYYCDKLLVGIGHTELKEELACVECFQERVYPNCQSCKQQILGEASEFDGKLYHYDCVKCCHCHNPLVDGKYKLTTDDHGKMTPIDLDCFMIKKYKLT